VIRRLIARALWQVGPVCFRCGAWADDCRAHMSDGEIMGARRRRWVPLWLASLVHWRRAVAAPRRRPNRA
jgi:hypothetical protein